VGIYLYRKSPTLDQVKTALNPFDPNNLASSAANAGVQAVTGDPNQTVGGWFYDLLNPDAGLAPGETRAPGGVIIPAPKQTTPAPLSSWDQYGMPTF
jgi:hypothetical protein